MQVASAQSAPSGAPILRPKSGRTPLQPKNTPPCFSSAEPSKPKQEWLDLSLLASSNKENHRPFCAVPSQMHYSLDASLAEELDAFKKKLERLRLESEGTENLLKKRDLVMEYQMKELVQRDSVQKELEMEVDRLFRLKELRSHCMKVFPIRTLREKERDKTVNGTAKSLDMETDEEEDESVPESVWLPVTTETLSVLG